MSVGPAVHAASETGGAGQRHNRKHQKTGQAGQLGQLPARAIQHDNEQNAGKGQKDCRLRVPKAKGEGDDDDRRRGDLGRAGRVHGRCDSGRRRLGIAQSRLAGHGCLACWRAKYQR